MTAKCCLRGSNSMKIIECHSDEEVANTFEVMRQLRDHLSEHEYLPLIREIQGQGGRLIAALDGDRCVGCSLFRHETRLFTGPMIYVDDLVTDETRRSQGVGSALLNWIEDFARQNSIGTIALDSGVHRSAAHKFYFRNGLTITSFNFKKSVK